MDKHYSEADFEYLPNGGWGENVNFAFTLRALITAVESDRDLSD